MKKPEVPEPTIRSFEDFEEYRSTHGRLVELQIERQTMKAESTKLLDQLNSADDRDSITQKALQLIRFSPSTPPIDVTATKERLTEVRARIHLLDRAIELQTREVSRVESDLSKKICADVLPFYQGLVREFSTGFAHDLERFSRLREFLRGLQDSGIKTAASLENFDCAFLDMKEPGSGGNALLREMSRFLGEGWEDPILAASPKPGAKTTVRLLGLAAGPEGIVQPGQKFRTEYAEHLIATRQAVAA